MEKDLSTEEISMELFKKQYNIQDARQLNPLVLAFLGDAVYELIVRTHIIDQNSLLSAHKLHLKAIGYVKAKAQSEAMKEIMESLTEEETAIYKRGRNTKSATVPKNADLQEYRTATGFEALIGFLYITGQLDRVKELICRILK